MVVICTLFANGQAMVEDFVLLFYASTSSMVVDGGLAVCPHFLEEGI